LLTISQQFSFFQILINATPFYLTSLVSLGRLQQILNAIQTWQVAALLVPASTTAIHQDTYCHCVSGGYRENYFTVGLTNNTPATMSPVHYGYVTCGQWPSVTPEGATMFVQCTDSIQPARYVVIIGHQDALNLCEVEVYGDLGEWLNCEH